MRETVFKHGTLGWFVEFIENEYHDTTCDESWEDCDRDLCYQTRLMRDGVVKVLNDSLHAFTTLNGLWVTDRPDAVPEVTWQIDEMRMLAQLGMAVSYVDTLTDAPVHP
jgi:hypothetical protein